MTNIAHMLASETMYNTYLCFQSCVCGPRAVVCTCVHLPCGLHAVATKFSSSDATLKYCSVVQSPAGSEKITSSCRQYKHAGGWAMGTFTGDNSRASADSRDHGCSPGVSSIQVTEWNPDQDRETLVALDLELTLFFSSPFPSIMLLQAAFLNDSNSLLADERGGVQLLRKVFSLLSIKVQRETFVLWLLFVHQHFSQASFVCPLQIWKLIYFSPRAVRKSGKKTDWWSTRSVPAVCVCARAVDAHTDMQVSDHHTLVYDHFNLIAAKPLTNTIFVFVYLQNCLKQSQFLTIDLDHLITSCDLKVYN